jgi:phosphoadenosine phosphosulfate reductase
VSTPEKFVHSKHHIKTVRLCGTASVDYEAKLAHTAKLLHEVATYQACALASSLAAEDMVLLHLIAEHRLPINVFTLNTGRLPAETLALLPRIEQRYGIDVNVFTPVPASVQQYEQTHGRDAFYKSIELRKACCAIRKAEPLRRALLGRQAWVTGLRKTQSVTRTDLPQREWDATHGLHKYNPLTEWTEGDVWHFIDTFEVPYNPLHDRFYPSIGCEPCTRAVSPGEDIRAGRWWWEQPDSKECGLHQHSTAVPKVHAIKELS